MDESKIITTVKRQYEELPYPPRNPEDEKNRLQKTVGDTLAELNHHCFKGEKKFDKDFRCLVAGGGTGDSVIFLAEQLRNTSAQIYYLDMSSASRSIAEHRAQVRGLTNITWISDSILSLEKMDIGEFDYINCSGVLHHLNDPAEGLLALKSVLKENGAIYLMLYAKYGRHSVYMMQSLLNDILSENVPIDDKIHIARELLLQLPESNEFKTLGKKWENEISPQGYGDSGLYDLLLHSVDQCFDVNEIFNLASSVDMNVISFLGNMSRFYEPEYSLKNGELLQLIQGKSMQERYSIGEKLTCKHVKHQFYLSRHTDCQASLDDEQNVFVLTNEMENQHDALHMAIKPNELLSLNYSVGEANEVFQLKGNLINKACFKYLDGKTPIKSIVRKVKIKVKTATELKIKQELNLIFKLMHPMGWIYLQKIQ